MRRALVLAALLGALVVAPVAAQDPPLPDTVLVPPRPDVVLSRPEPELPSPTGAFLRSLAVPGWGQAAIGSYTRAAFYVAVETSSAYALIRTRIRLQEAREHAALRERVLRRALADEGVTEPAEVAARLDENPRLADARRLVAAREEQQEDWVALTIFLVLLGGADAFVSAHLRDFPEPLEVGLVPGPDGRIQVAVRIPVP